ncbi:hypothetical protein KKA13_03910 [Patescibacteria group bacterium]|nr:hypothetical protein [Patescibacteria group bacterium]MBU1612996.1 hypothetical protein [Patescibacteria group bacterium]
MPPKYNLEKIKFATDQGTFERAVKLYEGKKIIDFKEDFGDYTAVVRGTELYKVFVSGLRYDKGSCECYLGKNNILCKHMVAVAIHACLGGKKIGKKEKESVSGPVCSGRLGELSEDDLVGTKKFITDALRYIKAYNGPSRTWFAYQNSLSEGCARLSVVVAKLPICEQTAKLLVDLLLRLDKKLCTGGVDDSDGTVGGFVEETVSILQEFAKFVPSCIKAFKKLCGQSTCFGWEEPLVRTFDEL